MRFNKTPWPVLSVNARGAAGMSERHSCLCVGLKKSLDIIKMPRINHKRIRKKYYMKTRNKKKPKQKWESTKQQAIINKPVLPLMVSIAVAHVFALAAQLKLFLCFPAKTTCSHGSGALSRRREGALNRKNGTDKIVNCQNYVRISANCTACSICFTRFLMGCPASVYNISI